MWPASYVSGKKCMLCQRQCIIEKRGFCNARVNINGKIYSLVYGEPTGFQIDPIEKKPLFHFNPGTHVLSFGTQGCNFRCPYCCNYFYSQAIPEKTNFVSVKPEQVVEQALINHVQGIAYTYNEPTIFFEYALDIARIANHKSLFNVFVTNGSTSKEPLRDINPFLDAVVIDFKGFNEKFYKISGAKLSWVKNAVEYYSNLRAHKEITNLIVPGYTDSPHELKKFARFIINTLGSETPVHLLKFFPLFKMENIPETPLSTLKKAKEILESEGMKFVYLGNVPNQNTYCPNCKKLLIERGYAINSYLKNDYCPYCGEKINIVINSH